MNDKEREFEERKKNLICTIMKEAFEEECVEYLKRSEWTTVEELDAWFDQRLSDYDETRNAIKEYYDSKIYS